VINNLKCKIKGMPIDPNVIYYIDKQCNKLKEWERKKLVIERKISEELYEHMKEIVTRDGCRIIWDRKENKVTIIKPNRYGWEEDIGSVNIWREDKVTIKMRWKEEDLDLLEGLDDIVKEADKEQDMRLSQKEKEVSQKEKEVSQKEKEVLQKEKEVLQKEKEVYIAKLSLDFNKWILFLLRNYDKLSVEEIKEKLEELDKIISNYDVIWDERERNNILLWLETLKKLYEWKEDIEERIETIIKKVKKSKLNSNIA